MDRVEARLQGLGQRMKVWDKKFASSVRKHVRKAVAEAADDAAEVVRQSAKRQGLRKAAAAVYVRTTFGSRSAGAKVIVSRARAPYARAFEFGNYGLPPDRETFFNGTDGLVRKRPFFMSSITKRTPEMNKRILKAIDDAVAEAFSGTPFSDR